MAEDTGLQVCSLASRPAAAGRIDSGGTTENVCDRFSPANRSGPTRGIGPLQAMAAPLLFLQGRLTSYLRQLR